MLPFETWRPHRRVARTVASEATTDMGQNTQNDVRDPERHLVTVNCRIARGSFDHLVGTGQQAGRQGDAERLGGR
jgi:hypothetical protein